MWLAGAFRATPGALAGAFYSLIVAGRARSWGFTTFAIATVINSIAGVLQAQPTILFDALG